MRISSDRNNALMEFFSTQERPITLWEMLVFWRSLEDSEKEYFKTVPLI